MCRVGIGTVIVAVRYETARFVTFGKGALLGGPEIVRNTAGSSARY